MIIMAINTAPAMQAITIEAVNLNLRYVSNISLPRNKKPPEGGITYINQMLSYLHRYEDNQDL